MAVDEAPKLDGGCVIDIYSVLPIGLQVFVAGNFQKCARISCGILGLFKSLFSADPKRIVRVARIRQGINDFIYEELLWVGFLNLNYLLYRDLIRFLEAPLFICAAFFAFANECECAPIAQVPNFFGTHLREPLLDLCRQLRNTIILTCSYYNKTLWNFIPNKTLKPLRRFKGVKALGHLDLAGGIDDNNMQTSLMVTGILSNVGLFSVNGNLSIISTIVSS